MNASRRLLTFLIMMRGFMAVATLMLLLGMVALAGNDALTGALSLGAFAMVYFLTLTIARGVQEAWEEQARTKVHSHTREQVSEAVPMQLQLAQSAAGSVGPGRRSRAGHGRPQARQPSS